MGEAFIAISEAVTPAVVRIVAEQGGSGGGTALGRRLQDLFGANPVEPESDPRSPVPEVAGGSGFIVSPDGYILTNHHVIADAARITVALADKRTFAAQVVGSDPLTDVAVIRIAAEGLPAVPLGDSDSTRVGEWVLAIGNPGFDGANTLDFTVTGGIISAKGRGLEVLAAEESAATGQENLVIEDFIQTDAVINPGNSGGPLVNLRGAVIGINTAIASTTGSYQGYGFAIPSNLVRRVMRDLVTYGFMRRALLGITIGEVTAEDAEVYGLPAIAGVLVEDFGDASPAERAGLQRHDVIVAVDGQAVDQLGRLQQLIAQHDPGDDVALDVFRYGERRQFRVRLQEAPQPAALRGAPAAPRPDGVGIEVSDITAEVAEELGYRRAGGALISRVQAGSAAFQHEDVAEGLMITAIDRQPVSSASDARRLLRLARSGRVLSLQLADADGNTYIANLRVP
jgi:serine protease Do